MGPPPHARKTLPIHTDADDKTHVGPTPLPTGPAPTPAPRNLQETIDETPTRVVSQAAMGHLLQRLTPKSTMPPEAKAAPKTLRQILDEPTIALTPQVPVSSRKPTTSDFTTTLIDDIPNQDGTVVQSHPITTPSTIAPQKGVPTRNLSPATANDKLRRAAKARNIDLTESEERADTIVGTQAAHLSRVLGAALIDALIVLLSGVALAATEMLLFDGRFPKDKGLLESIAVWVHVYRHTALRALGVTCGFFLVYSTFGALFGQTLGRAWMRLILLRTSGKKATLGWAGLRAVLGLLSVACFGAGAYWMIVDSQHRSLSDILTRAQIGSTKRV